MSRLPGVSSHSRAVGIAAIAGVAVTILGGCTTNSGTTASGGHHAARQNQGSLNAAKAVALASKKTQRITSLTMTETVTMSGLPVSAAGTGLPAGSHVHMVMHAKERLKPKLVGSVSMSISAAGRATSIDEIITSSAMYLKAPGVMPSQSGKPWAKISLSSLPNAASLRQLFEQAQNGPAGQMGPQAMTKLLTTAKNVHVVGHPVVDGVPTTEYSGDLTLSKIISLMQPAARGMLEPQMAGLKVTSPLRIWVDGNHYARKVQLRFSFRHMAMSVQVHVTSVNQPVTIVPPPASQVAPISGQ
ncbi:MAG TPA: hypothetical protein VLX90_20255 [Steroidobacteraceae bacterium]|nr:hypothetical protein [Steroidobacteraceae bacterium]